MSTAVTTETFEQEVLQSDKPVIVDFWAEWCGPCHAVSPVLDKIAEERADELKLVKINVDEDQELMIRYGVQSIPTIVLFKDGEPAAAVIGAQPKGAIERGLGLERAALSPRLFLAEARADPAVVRRIVRSDGRLLLVNPVRARRPAHDLLAAAERPACATHVLRRGRRPGGDSRRARMRPRSGSPAATARSASVAPVAFERDLPFVCVPFGTRNHFARDAGTRPGRPGRRRSPRSRALERRIDVGRVGDRLFLNNVSLGVYAHLVHRRERAPPAARSAGPRLRALALALRRPQPVGRGGRAVAERRCPARREQRVPPRLRLSLGERERLDEGLPPPLRHRAASSLALGGAGRAAVRARARAGDRCRPRSTASRSSSTSPLEVRIEPRALRLLEPRR